jgi:hypothetical protein
LKKWERTWLPPVFCSYSIQRLLNWSSGNLRSSFSAHVVNEPHMAANASDKAKFFIIHLFKGYTELLSLAKLQISTVAGKKFLSHYFTK